MWCWGNSRRGNILTSFACPGVPVTHRAMPQSCAHHMVFTTTDQADHWWSPGGVGDRPGAFTAGSPVESRGSGYRVCRARWRWNGSRSWWVESPRAHAPRTTPGWTWPVSTDTQGRTEEVDPKLASSTLEGVPPNSLAADPTRKIRARVALDAANFE